MRPLLLVGLLVLAGCAQPDGRDAGGGPGSLTASGGTTSASASSPDTPGPRPGRDYLLLTILGTLTQSPPHQGPTAVCGCPTGPYAGIDLDGRRLLLVRDRHDFQWDASWTAVQEDIDVQQDGMECNHAFVYSAEAAFEWTFGDRQLSIAPAPGGALVDGTLVPPGGVRTIRVDVAGPNGSRIAGDVDLRVEGPWSTADILEVDEEADVTHGGGYWASTEP